ncbi:unnamed protein product [Ceutorhynchus assimilis]|uniref:CHK kinase-like domain-containing protein n=1 Tax=Ceutorhynchus assimilis TaxID=467358 RepID=A0A9N9MNA7_9CUCU|nr:unnamed protein product [Ceutorhynchus assimilis]
MKQIVMKNDFNKIKVCLKKIAENQPNNITSEVSSKYFLENLTEKCVLKELFKSIKFKEVLDHLKSDFEELLRNGDSLFFSAYEAFLLIFSSSNEKFRQNHFEELITDYYKHFEAPKNLIEQHKNVILPLVKLQLIDNDEIAQNLLNYLKNPFIHQENIYQIIKKKFQTNDIELINFDLVTINEKFGHMSKYYHLKIRTSINNKIQEDTLFIKLLFSDSELVKQIAEAGAAKKESFFYNTLYPLYEEYGLRELLDFAPKCYLATAKGLIVLENIKYSTLKSDTFLNVEQLKLVLDKIAKFHVCSLILEELLSEKLGKPYRIYDEYPEYFQENIIVPQGELYGWVMGGLLATKYFIKQLQKSNKNIEEKLNNIWQKTYDQLKKSTTLRNVVNHGDMYICNMMLNSDLQDVILFDFQLLRYLPPAFEILFFIFSSTTKETRDKYLQTLLDYYYGNLSENLKKFNLNPEELLPRTDFLRNVTEAKAAAMAVAMVYHPIHMDPQLRDQIIHAEEAGVHLDSQREKLVDLAWKDEHFRTFGTGFAKDFIELIENVDE